MNLATILTDSARRDRDRMALKLEDVAGSNGHLDDASTRVAALLRQKGLRPGDRVAIMLPNVSQFALASYPSAWKARGGAALECGKYWLHARPFSPHPFACATDDEGHSLRLR